MARRSDHTREELRDMSIRAARAIVRAKGTQALTARAVARRIGYTVGTLYQMFDNFDHLVLAVNIKTVSEIRRRMEKATHDLVDPKAKLKAIAHAYTEYALAHPGLWRLAFEHQMPELDNYPSTLTDQTDAIFVWISDLLGQLTAAPRDEIAAAALWSGVHGVCHLSVTSKLGLAGTRAAMQVVDQMVDSVIAGAEQKAAAARA
ncbi:MAG: TetR/AcrR family transcriptional regulator [Gammaproteobacteria bacterium]|nr:TetR/AcrR family transcriptional regulator [Gammaproteobacteria bacterium]